MLTCDWLRPTGPRLSLPALAGSLLGRRCSKDSGRSRLTVRTQEAGLTLLELLVATALFFVLVGLAATMMDTALKGQRVESALELVKANLQNAREFSMAQRRLHRVQLQASREVILDRLDGPSLWTPVSRATLPDGVEFAIEPGIPTTGQGAPGGVETSLPIDFNGENEVIFRPNGSAIDASGRICTGVAYLTRPGHPESVRAVTVFGPTGRIRTWRLRSQNGQSTWK